MFVKGGGWGVDGWVEWTSFIKKHLTVSFNFPCNPKLEEDKGLHEDWPWLGKVVDQRTSDTKLGESVSF